jgi:hypothetical protein
MPESVTDRPTKSHEYIFLLTKKPRYYYDADAVREKGVATWNSAKGIGHGSERSAQYGEMMRTRGYGTHHEDKNQTGRNLRTVWTIPTQPYSKAHFATFPEKLPEICIKAGTSARGCCPECGAPWKRTVEAESSDGRRAIVKGGKAYDEDGHPLMGDNMIDPGVRGAFNSGGATLKRRTVGWERGCECYNPDQVCPLGGDPDDCKFISDPVPCVVLDCFSGAGTVGVVAKQLGRSFIGIELNPAYAEMARRRIANPYPEAAIPDVEGQTTMEF